VHLALEALSHIKDQWPELHLVVVGRGPEAAALKSQTRQLGLEGRVTFTGFDAQPQRWMRASDAVLVPSYAEGLPLVVFEAFANGKPVLAFENAGM
jgi:glycosyltransferase involved in cell wall biosynthesis